MCMDYVSLECTLPYKVNSDICLLACLLDLLIVCLICHPIYGRKPLSFFLSGLLASVVYKI